ncbi:hypothetical protein E4U49_003161 [Claviceps purpurea]|nr:hypothetical protein E4U49_003161 [Claviceps purpurea]
MWFMEPYVSLPSGDPGVKSAAVMDLSTIESDCNDIEGAAVLRKGANRCASQIGERAWYN